MEPLWTSLSLASHSYLNVSLFLLLRTCHPRQPTEEGEEEEEGLDQHDAADFSFSLSDIFDWFASSGEAESGESGGHWETGDDCHGLIHADLVGAVSVATVLKLLLGAALTLVLCGIVRRKLSAWRKKKEETAEKEAAPGEPAEGESSVSVVGSVSSEGQQASEASSIVIAAVKGPVVISLGGGGGGGGGGRVSEEDPCGVVACGADFLAQTAECLVAQLDLTLGVSAAHQAPTTSPTTSTTTASSLLSPRLPRKGSLRRPRWRTLTSLPLELAAPSPDEEVAARLWRQVGDMERRMAWTTQDLGDLGDLDLSAVQDGRLSAILQFHQQNCPVRAQQWSAACLVVNYLLTLLERDLVSSGTASHGPLKVSELKSFGSAADATCIGRANRFNVMMVLRLPSCGEMSVHDCQVCEDIPAGRLALGVKEGGGGGGGTLSPLVQKDRIGDSFGSFLSVREVVRACQRMVTAALDRLKLRSKGVLDCLPFSLHLSQYSDLLISIDTRMLNGLGLGLSEISLRLTPAWRVSSEENHPLPRLYAVPTWNLKSAEAPGEARSGMASRIMRSRAQGVAEDLLWQLNGCELTRAFMTSARDRLRSAGVWGCQTLCQQTLRAAFSPSGKDTLLTSGEVNPLVLDSVVLFLLLESPAAAWTLHRLSDRFSDCVHFLRSAVQSRWMPGFPLHNPHLLRQMPALRLLPLLRGHRQENLLASLRSEEVEGVLAFMESRLQETGLWRCVKGDYSTEMWEYEFFIFG